jgi:hypothetical protein
MGVVMSNGGVATVENNGWNCFDCKHRHAGQALAYICIGCPCRFRYCEGCQTVIDPETCGCGSPIDGHSAYEGHMAIPMGCGCYYEREQYSNGLST